MSRILFVEAKMLPDNETWWMNCVFAYPSEGYCLAPKHQLFSVTVLRYAMSAISILVSIMSAYVVVRSKSLSREYSAMMVIALVVWLSVDVVVQWLGDPFLLFPTLCVYHRAVLASVQLNALAGSAIVQSLVMFGIVTYFALFIYRHQKIAPAESLFKFSLRARIVFLFALLLPYLGIGPLFYVSEYIMNECAPIAKTLRHLESNDWTVIKGSTTKEPVVDRERIDFYPLKVINYALLIFNGLFASIFIFIIAHHTFAQIRNAKNLSPNMQRLHRVLTRSLIFQALTPLFFIIIPIGIATLTQYIFARPQDVVSERPVLPFVMALVLFSCHATAHSVVLIGTTPAFRAKLLQMVSCLIPHRIAPQQHLNYAGQSAYLSFTGTTPSAPQES